MSGLPARARRAAGFTLIEVLVGALVLAVFVSFVYGTVVSTFQVRTVIQSTTSSLQSGSMAIDLVARDLECAFWRPVQEFDAFKAEDDAGRTKVDFLTTLDSRRQDEFDRRLLRSDVTETGYRLRQAERGHTLFRREQFGVDDKPLEGGDFYKVISGVTEFTIDWFEEDPTEDDAAGSAAAADAEDGEKTWSAKEKKKLPRAARITLVIEGASSDPERFEETQTFRFTRWVVLPGADDAEPAAAAPGNNPPGNNPPGNNPPGNNPPPSNPPPGGN